MNPDRPREEALFQAAAQLDGDARSVFLHSACRGDAALRARLDARALYVQSLAEPADAGGLARRRDELNEAERGLQGLTDEARQLHDSTELLAWITAAKKTEPSDGSQTTLH